MAEVTFAKQFLAQLDSRPSKLSSDWVTDARQLPAQPIYSLPKPSVPFPAPSHAAASSTQAAAAPSGASSTPDITVTLKPLRGAPTTLPPVSASTASIYDLKALCGKQTGYAPDKIKILWERRPVADSKTLGEVLGDAAQGKTEVELGVMFVGQPTATPGVAGSGSGSEAPAADAAKDETPVAQGQSGADVLKTPQFWRDLEGWMLQRVRDEAVGKDAVEVWKKAWAARGP
ncbi:hypothetical protein FH972_022380 [Carpinus fangiana]|uniref:Ubiquitin-like domain-containing protein n=1 Tax=Carpinus fangiana TaxID=176857 RepID=A0A5N6KSF0_9ROSI|nr:hypothetical protein FH972_022380 [Carpinus fangiana]